MGKAHSFGRFFVVFGAPQGAGSPLVDRALTRELEEPHRTGDALLARLPFTGHRPTRGVVIGRWRKPTTGTPVGPSEGT